LLAARTAVASAPNAGLEHDLATALAAGLAHGTTIATASCCLLRLRMPWPAFDRRYKFKTSWWTIILFA